MELVELRPKKMGVGSKNSEQDLTDLETSGEVDTSGSTMSSAGSHSDQNQSSWLATLRRGSRPLFSQRSDTTMKQALIEGKRVSFLAVYEVIECICSYISVCYFNIGF